MNKWIKLANRELIENIISILKVNNIDAYFVQSGKEAKEKVLGLLPKKSRVLVSSSETLEQIGIKNEVEDGVNFTSVRKEYMAFDHEKEADKIRISRSTPDIIIGSVQAVTKDGKILVASNTGSQIAGYASSAGKVIWVVGAQKIVKDLDEGFKRIYDYNLPKESERLQKLFGIPSAVSKILIINRESRPGRITLIFVNEVLGI